MCSEESTMSNKKVFTLPNLLSFLRILMIPWFVHLYVKCRKLPAAAGVLALSGATDVLDGFIARKFNMVSDFGKVLDPVADKLTQTAMLICLVLVNKLMLVPLVLMAVKELIMGISGYIVIRKTGKVLSANWHGKLNTCMLYAMMIIHILWPAIPFELSAAMIGCCTMMMTLSCCLYLMRNLKAVNEYSAENEEKYA